MVSSSKIDIKDVSWWMFIKNVYKLGVLVTVRLLKEGCISLVVGHFALHVNMTEKGVGPPQPEKHIFFPKWVYRRFEI